MAGTAKNHPEKNKSRVPSRAAFSARTPAIGYESRLCRPPRAEAVPTRRRADAVFFDEGGPYGSAPVHGEQAHRNRMLGPLDLVKGKDGRNDKTIDKK